MAWIRIDDNAPHHRKMLQAGPAACWLWVCGLAYCQRMLSDGFIPNEAMSLLGVKSWKTHAPSLIAARLWHQTPDGYQIHDYLNYQFSASESETRKTKHSHERSEAGRIGGLRSGEARHAKQIEAKRPKQNEANSEANDEANVGSKTQANEAPSPPIPSPPKEVPLSLYTTMSNPSVDSSPSSPLVMSPLRFDKLRQSHAFIGSRLRVPNVLHDELRTKLGGDNPTMRLLDWYYDLNAEVEQSGEPILDVFVWLRPKFLEWAGEAVADLELARHRPKGA